MKRIIFFCNDSHSFLHYREDLLKKLIFLGYEVSCIIPYNTINKKIKKLGVSVYEINYKRHFSVTYDILTIISVCKILFIHKFDIIQTITLKPNIYGILLSFIFKIKKRYALVTGAGPLLNTRVRSIGKFRKTILHILLKISLRYATNVIFQNKDDIRDFIKYRFVKETQSELVEGSGVDSKIFSLKNVNRSDISKIKLKYKLKKSEKVILMVGRLIVSKGIIDLLKASKENKLKVKFIIIAPREKNYFFNESINQSEINKYKNSKLILIDKYINDIRPFLSISDLVIYPSNYREGIPRFLIEALAFSKPILTKKNPGCKETVIEYQNGLFIKNYKDINKKIEYIFKNNKRYKSYCKKSFEIFNLRFKSSLVINKMILLYEKS